MSSEFLLSIFCAVFSSTAGCFFAYIFGKKSLRFLIVEWCLLVFAFTFLLAILTFSDGRIYYQVNFYAPVAIPLFSFLRLNVGGFPSSVDYLIVGAVLFLFVSFFGWLSGELISGFMNYGFDYIGAAFIVAGALVLCLFLSFCSLRKYKLMVGDI